MKLTETQLLEALDNLPERVPVNIATGAYVLRADIVETVQELIERNKRHVTETRLERIAAQERYVCLHRREQAVEKAERHWRKLSKALKSLEVAE